MNTDKIYAEAIANEYAPKDTSKVLALRKLDRKAKSKANIFAMGVLGDGGGLAAAGGIILGLLGMAGAGLNYPIYKKLLSAGKEKYAFEIIQLAREISESAE